MGTKQGGEVREEEEKIFFCSYVSGLGETKRGYNRITSSVNHGSTVSIVQCCLELSNSYECCHVLYGAVRCCTGLSKKSWFTDVARQVSTLSLYYLS